MYLVAGIIEISLPVVVILYVRKKYDLSLVVVALGGGMFLLSLVRIPLNSFVASNLSRYLFGPSLLVLSALFPSLTAGVFEEGCRFAGYKYAFGPDARNFKNGLLYGAGHGGAESILLRGVNNVILFFFLMFAPALLPALALAQVQAVPLYLPLVGAVEGVLAFCIQVGLSIVVLQCFLKNSRKYLGYAVGFHTLIDFTVIMAAQKSIFLSEALLGVFAVLSLYFIWKFRSSP